MRFKKKIEHKPISLIFFKQKNQTIGSNWYDFFWFRFHFFILILRLHIQIRRIVNYIGTPS